MTGVDLPRMSAILAAFALVSAGQALNQRSASIRSTASSRLSNASGRDAPGRTREQALARLAARIVREPRIQGTVTDIVVEFGSSRYQD